MASPHRRRVEAAERVADAIAPPDPDPEQERRENEAFLDQWAAEIAEDAVRACQRRARGEHSAVPVDRMTGLQVCGEVVSYNGFEPPESVRAALRRLTHAEPGDGHLGGELTEAFNEATLEALRRAFALFREGT